MKEHLKFGLKRMMPISAETSTSETETKVTSLLRLYTFFLLMFQTLFKLSDTALTVLLTFLAMFFQTIGDTLKHNPVSFTSHLPRNVRAARLLATTTDHDDAFVRYVCCPLCHSLHSRKLHNGQLELKKCTFQQFPHHPHALLKHIKSSSGKQMLYPCLTYC